MEAIERAANLSVSRACAFSGLAAFCMMVGFSYDPHLSARVAGSCALITSLILAVKAWLAPTTPYKRTETWLLLSEKDRPAPDVAQAMISTVLRRIFLTYACICAVLAALLLFASVLFGLLLA